MRPLYRARLECSHCSWNADVYSSYHNEGGGIAEGVPHRHQPPYNGDTRLQEHIHDVLLGLTLSGDCSSAPGCHSESHFFRRRSAISEEFPNCRERSTNGEEQNEVDGMGLPRLHNIHSVPPAINLRIDKCDA